jgi:uncharacterized membrane protein required for colicin V production
MTPATLTAILAVAVLLFVLNGFLQGLIHMIGSIVGLIIGVAVSSRFDVEVGTWLSGATGWNKSICTVVGFVILLIVVIRVFGIILHLLEKTFGFLKIPLVGLANHLAGGVLGFFEGVFVCGATLMVIESLPFPVFTKIIAQSNLAVALIMAATVLLPLLPKQVQVLYKL